MAQKIVGSLAVDLALNTASFSKDLGKMSQLSAKTANDIKKSLLTIGTAVTAMATAVTGATTVLISRTIESAASMALLAQAAGTTTEKLSTLAYAARLNHLPMETLGKGLEKLSKSSLLAQNGNAQLSAVFKKLGVSVMDSNGHLRDSSDIFNQVSTKLATVKDGAGKTAIAMTLFGRAGAEMIPLMNKWGVKQQELSDQAKKFGLVLGSDTAQNMVMVSEGLEQLKEAGNGFVLQLTSAALPALQDFITQLQQIAKDANIPQLAKTFGASLSTAIRDVGTAIDFAVKHLHGITIAVETLIGLKLASWFIPLTSDLLAGSLSTIAAGFGRAALSATGFTRAASIIGTLTSSVWGYSASIVSLASTEGILATATYVATAAWDGFTAALLANPITAIATAITGISAALFYFVKNAKDAEVGGGEWADVWQAGVIGLTEDMNYLIAKWDELRNKMTAEDKANLAHPFSNFKALIQQAGDNRRAAAEMLAKTTGIASPTVTSAKVKTLTDLNTGGLAKDRSQPYQEAVAKLQQQIKAERELQAVQGASPDVIQQVSAANKSQSAILEINNKLKQQGKTLTTGEKTALIELYSTLANDTAITKFGDDLNKSTISTKLQTTETLALSKATLVNDQAIRDAIINNHILGMTYDKTTAQIAAMKPQLEAMRSVLSGQENASVIEAANNRIAQYQDETAAIKVVTGALLGNESAYRNAALSAQLLNLNEQIETASSNDVKSALIAKKQAIIDLTTAQYAQTDARNAQALLSPSQQYARETDALNLQIVALKKLQNGSLTYGQQLKIAAIEQDQFVKSLQQTTDLLLTTNSATDGVHAFFTEMQADSIKTARIFYDAMNQAVDGISNSLAKVMTGGKGNFGKMIQGVGQNMLQSVLKKSMEGGLGAIGKHFGLTGLGGKPDGSKAKPFHTIAGTSTDPSSSSGVGGVLKGLFGKKKADGSKANPYYVVTEKAPVTATSVATGFFKNMLSGSNSDGSSSSDGSSGNGSGGGGGFMSTLLQSLIPHANGGSVSPHNNYLVGEEGPEILSGASGYIHTNANSMRMLGNSGNHSTTVAYHIDARGTDPVLTEMRTKQAIIASHKSSVHQALVQSHQNAVRQPMRH